MDNSIQKEGRIDSFLNTNTNPNAHPKNKGLIEITTKKIIAKAAGFVKKLLSQGKRKINIQTA